MRVRIALVGDYDPRVVAHQAIPIALSQAVKNSSALADFEWRHTATLDSLAGYHGIWCVPASPYANEDAALDAIRGAREGGIPYLGTCAGFQYAVLEFARNAMGLHAAEHAETAVGKDCLVISRLSCSLVEVEGTVFAVPGSRLAQLYGTGEVRVGYRCNFGLDAKFEHDLEAAGMRVSARDGGGEARAVELSGHPFFVGTLFQPERQALKGENSPVIDAFVKAAAVFSKKTKHS